MTKYEFNAQLIDDDVSAQEAFEAFKKVEKYVVTAGLKVSSYIPTLNAIGRKLQKEAQNG